MKCPSESFFFPLSTHTSPLNLTHIHSTLIETFSIPCRVRWTSSEEGRPLVHDKTSTSTSLPLHFTSGQNFLIFQWVFFTVHYCHCHLFRASVPFIMSLSLLKTRLYLWANCVLSSPPFFKGLHQELMLLPWKQQLTEIINRMAVRPQNVGWTHKPPAFTTSPGNWHVIGLRRYLIVIANYIHFMSNDSRVMYMYRFIR